MLAPMLPSHVGDGATEVTWPQRGINVESCWRQCCQVKLVMALQPMVVLAVIRSRSPRAQSIKVLLHREEVRYSC
jgi:hypothetical protein